MQNRDTESTLAPHTTVPDKSSNHCSEPLRPIQDQEWKQEEEHKENKQETNSKEGTQNKSKSQRHASFAATDHRRSPRCKLPLQAASSACRKQANLRLSRARASQQEAKQELRSRTL